MKKEYLEINSDITNDWDARSYAIFGKYTPYEFTGWMDETLSWKETAYIHSGLGICLPIVEITGPDVIKMLTDLSVNSFNSFPVGAGRHVVMCNKNGNIMVHGVAIRLSEDTIRTIDLDPYISWAAKKGGYDVECRDVQEERFIFQVAGPKSLEIIEHAVKKDLHDIKLMRSSNEKIDGCDVMVLRIGMAGTLAYEIQGNSEDAQTVYKAVIEAGQPYGLRKMGTLTYTCNHTENGFPQQGAHFALAWLEDEEFADWCRENMPPLYNNVFVEAGGTYTDDVKKLFRNPIELGWSNIVKFNHEFVGRKALEKIAKDPKRTVVTLRWDPEDFLDIYRSYFQEGEPYKFFYLPLNSNSSGPMGNTYVMDMVQKNGKEIGSSVWGVYTLYYRSLISMGIIDIAEAKIGNQVTILWGDRGGRIKEVHATVDRYPFLDLPTNKDYDMESIPHYQGVN